MIDRINFVVSVNKLCGYIEFEPYNISLKQKATETFNKLEELNTNQLVNGPSDCISALALYRKSYCGLKICLPPKDLNKV